MPEKKPRSLRLLVLTLVGFSLSAFTVILLIIFYTAMPQMLLQSENRYLDKQMEGVEGLLDMSMHGTYVMADDIGIWDETVHFVQGDNPDYLSSNWPDVSMLRAYRFNFVVIRDLDGKVRHQEFLDYVNDRPMAEPEGFVRYLDKISNEVLDMYKQPHDPNAPVEELGKGGILFYNQAPYFVAAMPIMTSRGAGSPAGTVIMGSILDNQYFRDLTHYETLKFEVLPSDAPAETSQTHIEHDGMDTVSTTVPLKDIEGSTVLLRMSDSRIIYLEGIRIIAGTSILLILAMVLFGLVVYQLAVRMFLRPMENLSRDIGELGSLGALDTKKYSKNQELLALCISINDMLQRLDQSRISIAVLQRILNGLDVYLYVTDLETDEFLFVNSKMAEHYGLAKNADGQTCFSALRPGSLKRCAFCPKHQLLRDPEKIIVWEEHNASTGQYLRNTDCLIEWTDKRLVHLHHAADITNIKTAEAALQKRLEQQELMSAMSQTFISTVDTRQLILNALEMAGKFMGLDKILVVRLNDDGNALESEYEWFDEASDCPRPDKVVLPFQAGTLEYESFIAEKDPFFSFDDISGLEQLSLAREHGIKSLINIPVHVDGAFWGILSFGECKQPRAWTESDVQLCTLIGSVISAAITRSTTEVKLARMSSIVNSSPQYISYINPEGDFEYFNHGVERISGYTAEELKAGGIDMLFDDETNKLIREGLIPRIMKRGKSEFELPLHRKDGQVRTMAFSAFKTDFRPVGIGAIALDITEKRRLEKELLVAKEQAEQSSVAKSEFLSRMSHEMRTPLNAIIGMTNIAKAAPDLEKKEYCLGKIDDASNHLLGVINDILDMSKIEANKFELSFTEFKFEKMLLRVINVVNFRVDEKNQNLIIHVDPTVPDSIISDEQRLAQVIANLLANAVKFTPERGTITVTVSKLDEKNGLCTLRVEVADTGIGIAKDQIGKLFRSFEQADGGIARKFGGTGLGLAISKSIVEMMGGDIWVESQEGAGSSFFFTIKAQTGKAASRHALLSPEVNWKNMHVLVVDDAPDVREYFLNFSQSIGLNCEVAASGAEACELMERNKDTPFNIVFADWKMPGMDGIELTRRIKDNYGAKAVVIMISAAQWSDISEEARAAGVDSFLAKPLFSSLIVDCINECLGLRTPVKEEKSEAGAGESEENIFVGRRVLLAEDIEINREIVMALLQHTGVTIVSAPDGRKAVEMFKADPSYDLIFMDIHMPEVDGYEATRLIRALEDPRAKTVPIVAMTANVFREDIERCLASGMNDHVGKPVDVNEIIHKMRRFLLNVEMP